jgi:ATP-dependent DNA helicase PIF1
MMSASTFEKINVIFQTLRKSRRPFGGVQLILTGDFLQLETVFTNPGSDNRLIVESELFMSMFKNSTIVLRENFRQRSDNEYVDILMRIRKGKHTKNDISILNTRLVKQIDSNMIHLVSSNRRAQEINNKQLNLIDSQDHHFETIYTQSGDNETCELLKREFKYQFIQK